MHGFERKKEDTILLTLLGRNRNIQTYPDNATGGELREEAVGIARSRAKRPHAEYITE